VKKGRYQKTRAVFGWLWLAVGIACAALWLVALLVRLTVRDHFDLLIGLFYGTPWPVLAGLAFVGALAIRTRVKRIGWVLFGGSAICFLTWIVTGWRIGSASPVQAAFRVAYWNVARPEARLNGVLDAADSWKADIMVFGESKPPGPLPPGYATRFSPRNICDMGREMLMVTEKPPKREGGGSLGGRGGCQIYHVTIGGHDVVVLAVDFDAWFSQSREPAFNRLYEVVAAYVHKPLIVLGDFNTPSASVHFKRLRVQLTDAFETAGIGCAATWPTGLPVLELDHVFVSKHLRVVRCEHKTSAYSDHRAVVVDIAFP